jgi:hypothetical protein
MHRSLSNKHLKSNHEGVGCDLSFSLNMTSRREAICWFHFIRRIVGKQFVVQFVVHNKYDKLSVTLCRETYLQ